MFTFYCDCPTHSQYTIKLQFALTRVWVYPLYGNILYDYISLHKNAKNKT